MVSFAQPWTCTGRRKGGWPGARFTNLGPGVHHVVIRALGNKNANSTGTTVVFDAVTLR